MGEQVAAGLYGGIDFQFVGEHLALQCRGSEALRKDPFVSLTSVFESKRYMLYLEELHTNTIVKTYRYLTRHPR